MARRRSTQEIQQIIDEYRASGLTQVEYCRQSGVVLSTLGRYLRRGAGSSEQSLVRVKLSAPTGPEEGGFVLILSNGRRIASGWGFGEAQLGRLIRVAETA